MSYPLIFKKNLSPLEKRIKILTYLHAGAAWLTVTVSGDIRQIYLIYTFSNKSYFLKHLNKSNIFRSLILRCYLAICFIDKIKHFIQV